MHNSYLSGRSIEARDAQRNSNTKAQRYQLVGNTSTVTLFRLASRDATQNDSSNDKQDRQKSLLSKFLLENEQEEDWSEQSCH